MSKRQTSKSHAFWYRLCQVYTEGRYTSQMSFLRSRDSGEEVSNRHQRVFNRYLKKYQSGQLLNNEAKRDKRTMYDEVKEKLLQYIELREQLYTQDKCGLSWALLREKLFLIKSNSFLPCSFIILPFKGNHDVFMIYAALGTTTYLTSCTGLLLQYCT